MEVFVFRGPDGRQYFVLSTDPTSARTRLGAAFPSLASQGTITLSRRFSNLETAKNMMLSLGSTSVGYVKRDGNGALTGAMNFADNQFDDWARSGAIGSGGDVGDETTAGTQLPILGSEDIFDFRPAFEAGLRSRGINIGPGGGTLGRVASQQFNPIFARAMATMAFDPASEAFIDEDEANAAVGSMLQRFTGRAPLGPAGALQSNELFRRALEMSQGRTPLGGTTGGQGFGIDFGQNPLAGRFLNPATSSDTELAELARDAARTRFGSFAGFLPSASSLTQSFLSQPQAGALNAADYYNSILFGR